jgi:beta-phosphoglucomutase
MLKAIILDFNGVILDDEPLHFSSMRDAVAGFGLNMTREEYWDKYLPLDDSECLQAFCRDHSVKLDPGQYEQALAYKSRQYYRLLKNRYPLFDGAAQFVRTASERYPLALASGARREEIETTLQTTGLMKYFTVSVAAEDFKQGKPHPESFLLALQRLNDIMRHGSLPSIQPEECLVIEDSVGGVRGARAAGMACLAVSNSYPCEKLQAANRVVGSLAEVRLDGLQSIFEGNS